MKRALAPALLLAALAIAPAPEAQARDRLKASYPEGPIVAGNAVLFAEMHADRIGAWDEEGAKTFYKSAGCGPTAIAPYGDGYAVLCHLTDEIHLLSADGRRMQRLDRDTDGREFLNPNDASADGAGGIYFSAAGTFSRTAPAEGAVLYLDPKGAVRRLASGLHYANGVHFDRARRVLYVSEHLGGRILAYPETAPGRLGRPAVLIDLNKETIKGAKDYALTGPDGLETDADGNLYVAIYGAGALLIVSPGGHIERRIDIKEPLVTNIALADEGRTLIVTGSAFSRRKPFPGAVRKIANPLGPQ